MFVASYHNTMAGARPKLRLEEPERMTVAEMRRRSLEAENRRAAQELAERRAKIAEMKVASDEAIKAANEALRALHAVWAEEAEQQNQTQLRQVSSPITVERVVERFCKVFKLKPAELLSVSRARRLCFARHAVYYWSVRRTNKSLTQIGVRLGDRDHTTIHHGKEKYVGKRKAMGRTLRAV